MLCIKNLRVSAGVSRQELANTLEIDVSTIAKWESGASVPRATLLPKIADLFHCSIDALFGR